jgi:long-chain acyl-CoA synthetase
LTGRRSDIIKTSTGRRVALPKLEMHFRDVPGVDQLVLVGHGRSGLVAVATLTKNTVDTEGVATAVKKKNGHVLPYERVKGILFLRNSFSIERGELTGNLKLRRVEIEQHNAAAIDALYGDIRQGGPTAERVFLREG